MKSPLLLLAGASMIVATPAFAADYLYTFTAADGETGALTITLPGMTKATATAVSGTVDGFTVTGLSPYASSDNTFDPNVPHFTFGGFSVSASNGVNYNLFFNGANDALLNSTTSPGGNENPSNIITETVTGAGAVPEPATWAMMMLGFGMIGFGLRRRSKVSTTVRFA